MAGRTVITGVPIDEVGNYRQSVIPQYTDTFGGAVDGKQDRARAGGLTTRSVETVAVDPFTGVPITATQQGNVATRQALTRQQSDAFRETMGAKAKPLVSPTEPAGAFMVGKDNSRLGDTRYSFVPGEPQNPALGAIDNVTTVAMPRKRPNIEANPGMRLDTGLMGVPMSQGMSERLAGGEAMGMVPGVSIVRNPRVFQALAAQQQAAPAPAAPAAPAVLPTYATTEFQQNAFQTTPGAQMPGSMNNERWRTGY